MNILVKDILRLGEFKGVELIAGKNGLDNEVSNVTLMEVPDIFPYLEDNSLLLTTLYPIYNDEKSINELIPKLVEKGTAAIGIKPARYLSEIPQRMIDQADAFNIPLIKLPVEANLSRMANEVLTVSLKKNINILNFRNYVHQQMMEHFLNGEDLGTLVNTLSDIIMHPIILFDNFFNVLYLSKELARDESSYIVPGQMDPYDIINNKNRLIEMEVLVKRQNSTGKETCFIYPIKVGNDFFGNIALLNVNQNDENLMVAVGQAALVMASVFQQNRAVENKERNFLDAFIRDILQGRIKSQVETIQRAKAFGWLLEFPQIISVVKVFDSNERKKKDIYDELLRTGYIEKIMAENLIKKDNSIKVIYLDDSLVVFSNVLFVSDIKQSVSKAAGAIIERLRGELKVGIGISNIVENSSRFAEAYLEADESVKMGEVIYKENFTSHYDDLKAFKIIKEIKDLDVLKAYMNKVIGKVIEYDRKCDLKLLETLAELIQCNFNLQKASGKMFIHYNTMRYRVDKLRQLGINMDNGFDLGEIVLAYQSYIWLKANDAI